MNNNGARNAALDDGVALGYDWVLPFDGNCIFDAEEWRKLKSELEAFDRAGCNDTCDNCRDGMQSMEVDYTDVAKNILWLCCVKFDML